MTFNRDRFFIRYRLIFGRLIQQEVDGLLALLTAIEKDAHLTDVRHAAYILATTKHETAHTFQPITERGGPLYCRRYELGRLGRTLGNVQQGDGYRYRGRGYAQTTGRANYRRVTRAWNAQNPDELVDFERNPDLLLTPRYAYFALSFAMRTGLYTGRDLDDFINAAHCDYTNARTIINSDVKRNGRTIAHMAESLERCLRAAMEGGR